MGRDRISAGELFEIYTLDDEVSALSGDEEDDLNTVVALADDCEDSRV